MGADEGKAQGDDIKIEGLLKNAGFNSLYDLAAYLSPVCSKMTVYRTFRPGSHSCLLRAELMADQLEVPLDLFVNLLLDTRHGRTERLDKLVEGSKHGNAHRLAKATGVSYTAIYNLFHKELQLAPLATYRYIANALKISISDLRKHLTLGIATYGGVENKGTRRRGLSPTTSTVTITELKRFQSQNLKIA